MRAVVPLNITALRVSSTDASNITPGFAGRTVAFDKLPHHAGGKQASTGDTVWLPLENEDPPSDALPTGVHLHWELPEYFKRGNLDPGTGQITFPHAPTRWLVTRTLTVYDSSQQAYGPVQHASWIVESDYVSAQLTRDGDGILRPAVAVALTAPDGTPFMYMGRVVKAGDWNPASGQPQNYLPAYKGADGAPLYLTSIGFVGAAFSSYYPDCHSVFGFWDTFADVDAVHSAITQNTAIRFRVSYSVIGWLPDPAADPLTQFGAAVTSSYNDYVHQCAIENVAVGQTPADVFKRLASDRFGWEFSANAISFTLGADHKLQSVEVPGSTLCAGVIQDVVWSAEQPGTGTPFLATPSHTSAWSDQIEIAIGNTTVEAVSALIKSHLPAPPGSGMLASYEMLLDALQLGVLRDQDAQGNWLVTLEQQLHAKAFTQVDGGHQWTVQAAPTSGPGTSSAGLTLPLALAGQLSELNAAQQAYDSGRERLKVIRQQLFMDWVIFVKQWVAQPSNPVVDTNALSAFLATASGGVLNAAQAAGATAGRATYTQDTTTGHIVGVSTTDGPTTLAGQLAAAFQTVASALQALESGWKLDAVAAGPFWQPTDPVLLLEGDRLEPVRRNGPTTAIAVRADGELITSVKLAGAAGTFTVAATALNGLPTPPAALPGAVTVAAVIGEAALLDPQYAPAIAAASGAANPSALAGAIAACQGGQSPLDSSPADGLFAAVRAPGYTPHPDPAQTVPSPEQLTTTFTNAGGTALAPDPVAWNAQAALAEFSASRMDPFLPVWLTWTMRLDPLAHGSAAGYAPTTLEDQFSLDADVIELTYPTPASFTTGQPVTYQGSVILSKKPTVSLTQQIDQYMLQFPGDAADPELATARDNIAGRKILSQSLGTFNLAQTLRTTIPQIPVMDLVRRPDFVTPAIAAAANATPGDSWYNTSFNSLTPISTSVEAQYNFGPLRAGFLELRQLRIIDVFGQLMDLTTASTTSTGALRVVPSVALSPASGDTANAEKAYLPPRVLAPCRVDAHWLSAAHNDAPGVTQDFVEVNDHPATTPVCGWIVPNHLDVSLAFYDAAGTPIGSFGIEHRDSVYRTRAGNTANPHDDLTTDIGPVNTPKPALNPHVARLMWFIDGQPVSFLRALMTAIDRASAFINPANFAQDVALSTLIGQPLAIARMVQGLSTAGGVLPVNQANTSPADALAQTVNNGWTDYGQRQAHTCAGLDQVRFPVRLGDLTDIDDGLVAFLPEAQGESPYATVFSAAAPDGMDANVRQPAAATVELTLDGPVLTFTALVDPPAPVHITTGALPTAAIQIPPDQYVRAMQQLAVTFTTRPVLRDQLSLRLPLPAEPGFGWAWIAAGRQPDPLPAAVPADTPIYGYGPQRLLEGWLDLFPNPPSGER